MQLLIYQGTAFPADPPNCNIVAAAVAIKRRGATETAVKMINPARGRSCSRHKTTGFMADAQTDRVHCSVCRLRDVATCFSILQKKYI